MGFAKSVERRLHQRSKVSATGRVMLADRRECACTVIDVSTAGLALLAKDSGAAGEAVVLYVDGIGRIQGEIVRCFDGGFAVRVTGNSRAADELAQRFG